MVSRRRTMMQAEKMIISPAVNGVIQNDWATIGDHPHPWGRNYDGITAGFIIEGPSPPVGKKEAPGVQCNPD